VTIYVDAETKQASYIAELSTDAADSSQRTPPLAFISQIPSEKSLIVQTSILRCARAEENLSRGMWPTLWSRAAAMSVRDSGTNFDNKYHNRTDALTLSKGTIVANHLLFRWRRTLSTTWKRSSPPRHGRPFASAHSSVQRIIIGLRETLPYNPRPLFARVLWQNCVRSSRNRPCAKSESGAAQLFVVI